MADIDVVKVSEQTITIPEHIDFGSIQIRVASPSGTIHQGYKARVRYQVLDDSNNMVFDSTSLGYKFRDYVEAGQEVLGVATLSFNSSPLPQA